MGAQRSGTTYLYTILDEHPEICMAKPIKPEPKYFLQSEFDKIGYYDFYYKEASNVTKIYGEKSTSYYENEATARKISKYMPQAKIIFMLANPVNRAISNYKFSLENGLETRSIEDVFLNNTPINSPKKSTSTNPFDYRQRGVYYEFIDYYLKYFSKKNIKIIIKEEMVANIDGIQNLYRFLGVSDLFIPKNINRVVNSSKININVPVSVLRTLNEYYKNPNQHLQKILNRKMPLWR